MAVTQVVDAPVSVVWEVFTDLPLREQWLSEVDAVVVLATTAGGARWRETRRVRTGRSVSTVVEDLVLTVVEPGRRCNVALADDARTNELCYEFTPVELGPRRGATWSARTWRRTGRTGSPTVCSRSSSAGSRPVRPRAPSGMSWPHSRRPASCGCGSDRLRPDTKLWRVRCLPGGSWMARVRWRRWLAVGLGVLALLAGSGIIAYRVFAPHEMLTQPTVPYPEVQVITDDRPFSELRAAPLVVEGRLRVYAEKWRVWSDAPVGVRYESTPYWAFPPLAGPGGRRCHAPSRPPARSWSPSGPTVRSSQSTPGVA